MEPRRGGVLLDTQYIGASTDCHVNSFTDCYVNCLAFPLLLTWGILQVNRVVEEEYCLIPMGGVLPVQGQRVIGVGGTAGLVHPSTGYMVARTLGAVPQLADRVVDELSKAKDKCKKSTGACTRSNRILGWLSWNFLICVHRGPDRVVDELSKARDKCTMSKGARTRSNRILVRVLVLLTPSVCCFRRRCALRTRFVFMFGCFSQRGCFCQGSCPGNVSICVHQGQVQQEHRCAHT